MPRAPAPPLPEDLPIPHAGMTPQEKGELFRRWVAADVEFFASSSGGTAERDFEDVKVDPFDFMHADLRGPTFYGVHIDVANLAGANAEGVQFINCVLGSTMLFGANLRNAGFAGCSLNHAMLDGADIEGAEFGLTDLEGASLKGCVGTPKSVSGAIIDDQTYTESGWTVETLLAWIRGGARILSLETFPRDVRDAVLGAGRGLTLSFDTRLQRFDATAFDMLIAEVLGPETDVTIEQRSNLGADGPAFIRINGPDPAELVAVAERFYERAWRWMDETGGTALARANSTALSLMLARLDDMRDRLSELTASPDLFDGGQQRALSDGRFGAIARSVAAEAAARHDPPDADTFVGLLNADLHAAVLNLESQRAYVQHWDGSVHTHEDEPSLRWRLLTYLKGRGYAATAETDEGGRTDILVPSEKLGLLWIGECKVHGSYEALDEGLIQLHTRYASGRHRDTAFIIFCFNEDAALVAETWKARLVERRPCGMLGDPVDDPAHRLTFSTRHRHAASGLEITTRHIVVVLFQKPMDRSGRRSRGE